MLSLAAPAIGALITIMNGVNSRFSALVGALPAALAIHLVGAVLIGGVTIARTLSIGERRRAIAPAARLPFYLYLGGVAGVGTVFSCNYAYSALNASLAVALGLIGQTAVSIAADATGFMGKRREPLSAARVPGIALAMIGAAVIAKEWRNDALPIVVGLGSGICIGLNALLNAEHGRRNGSVRSAGWNYVTGLSTTALIVAATGPDWAASAAKVASAGVFLTSGGAALGVVIVLSLNAVFARMPAFRATLLVFSGQAAMGVVIDACASGFVDARKLAGTALVLCGLALDARSRKPRPEA